MTKGDMYTKKIFRKILKDGCMDKNPRPHYEDYYPNAVYDKDTNTIIDKDNNVIELNSNQWIVFNKNGEIKNMKDKKNIKDLKEVDLFNTFFVMRNKNNLKLFGIL